jgi:hypothetical protein
MRVKCLDMSETSFTKNRAGKPWSFLPELSRHSFWASGERWKKEGLLSQTLGSEETFCYSWDNVLL